MHTLIHLSFACGFAFLTLSASPAQAGPYFQPDQDPRPVGSKWIAVERLSDEFEDNSIDLEKWQVEPVGNGWNWIGRPPGLFKASNVSEADGHLKVTVSALHSPVKIKERLFLYQGAIVRSIHPGQPGWYFETRMKANATEMSSTFWLMTKGGSPKKLETDIQECVGRVSQAAADWAINWDQIFHSNCIQRTTPANPTRIQKQASVPTETKNHQRFYVYGAWWKSHSEIQFFLDGQYVYSIFPSTEWDVPAFIQMAIETYDWNPVPEDGGLVTKGTPAQRTTQYDWVRVWQLDNP